MKDSSIGRFTLVPSAISFVVGGALVWALHWPADGALGDWMSKSEAPAWAQAILSAGAIYAAARIARWQRESEQRDKVRSDALIARSFAIVILREMNVLQTRIDRALSSIKEPHGPTEGREVEVVKIPQPLWDSAREMYLLGEPGNAVLSSIFNIQEARQFLVTFAQSKHLLWGDNKDAYLDCLRNANSACVTATAELRKLLEWR